MSNPLSQEPLIFSGRAFTVAELTHVKETVELFPDLSRTELAETLCENLQWVTPNESYKTVACLRLLAKLEAQGEVTLPPKSDRPRRVQVFPVPGAATRPHSRLRATLADLAPVRVEPVFARPERHLWNEYVERYHPLGYKQPFGAHQRYFLFSEIRPESPLGCLLFAASAWALAPRDAWIGWTRLDRSQRLHLVVNNTRFLIFPWVQVPHLASKALSLVARRLRSDWETRYAYAPVLLETFVDVSAYRGTCYRAANWIDLGLTQGRGRMDRRKQSLSTPKRIFVYPLIPDFRTHLLSKDCSQHVTSFGNHKPLTEKNAPSGAAAGPA